MNPTQCHPLHQQTVEGIADTLSDYRHPYVSLSGGKDSMLMTYLTLQVDPDIEIIHSMHGAPYLPAHWPEVLVHAVQVMGGRNITTTPKNLIWTDHGNDVVLIGLRRAESQRRRKRMDTRPQLVPDRDEFWPLADWTTDAVWQCTLAHQVPYASIYADRPTHQRMHWATTPHERAEWDRLRYISPLIPDWIVYTPDPICGECGGFLDGDITRGHADGCSHGPVVEVAHAKTSRRSKRRSYVDPVREAMIATNRKGTP